jgi:uncharacterized membrane protein
MPMSDAPEQQTADDAAARRELYALPLDRFSAFSDGVFAIAITLLVLQISVPHEGARLLPALREQWPELLGYYISFAFIGSLWIVHAGITKFMKRGDPVAYALNLLLLLFVGLLPFATDLMVTHLAGADGKIAVLVYGVDLLLASCVLSLLILYLAHEPGLLVDDIAESTLRRVTRQRWIAIGLNVFAIGVALVAPQVAVGLYLVQTTILLIVPLVGLRRHRRQRRAA